MSNFIPLDILSGNIYEAKDFVCSLLYPHPRALANANRVGIDNKYCWMNAKLVGFSTNRH